MIISACNEHSVWIQVDNYLFSRNEWAFQEGPSFFSVGVICATRWPSCLLALGGLLLLFFFNGSCSYILQVSFADLWSEGMLHVVVGPITVSFLSLTLHSTPVLQIRRQIVQSQWLTLTCWHS